MACPPVNFTISSNYHPSEHSRAMCGYLIEWNFHTQHSNYPTLPAGIKLFCDMRVGMIWTFVKTNSKVKLVCIVICIEDTPYSMSQKPATSILLLYFPSEHISSISPWIYAAQCISWSHQSIYLEASRWWQARISRDTLGATASQLSDCTDMHPLH